MGTNYYVYGIAAKFSNGRKHLGKRSAGWDFALHVYPDEGINRLEDWLFLLSDKNAEVRDEYNKKIKLKHLLRIVLMGEGCSEAGSLASAVANGSDRTAYNSYPYPFTGSAVLNPFTNRLRPKPDWEHTHSIHTSYYCLNYNFV